MYISETDLIGWDLGGPTVEKLEKWFWAPEIDLGGPMLRAIAAIKVTSLSSLEKDP